MKVKKLLSSLLLLILILVSISSTFMIKRGWALPSATRVYVDPAAVVMDPDGIFTVDIKIEGALQVAAWQFELYYDSEILFTQQHPSDPTKQWVTDGGFLSSPIFTASVFAGQVGAGAFSFSESSGSGTLASVKFQVIGTGKTVLDLRETLIKDASQIERQPDAEEDGEFHTTIPRAEFFYSTEDHPITTPGVQPILNPVVNETVTFNATFFEKGASVYVGSYDPDTMDPIADPDGQIVNYAWDFGDGDTTTVTDPVITHVYDSVRSCTVNLTVTDNDGQKDSFDRSFQVVLHDLAITDIEVTPTTIRPGETATIDVTVLNKGTEIEAGFNVTTYYDDTLIWYGVEEHKTKSENLSAYSSPLIWNEETTTWGIDIDPEENITITWTWNTTGLGEGTYHVWANVSRVQATDPSKSVPGETLLADNEYHFGDVLLTFGAPVASFTFTPQQPREDETVTFNATASNDTPPGWIENYIWDFGDGDTTTVTDPVITHVYDSVRSCTVNLTVTDNDGQKDSFDRSFQVVLHDLAITDIEVTPTTIRPGETATIDVTVLNKGTEIEAGFNVTTYYDDTLIWYGVEEHKTKSENLSAYSSPLIWNEETTTWGIDIDPEENITITWTWNTTGLGEGTYHVWANVSRVQATDPSKSVPGETLLADNEYHFGDVLLTFGAPVASFTFTPQQPREDETVTFNATASNDTPPGWIENYIWDFGDGNTTTVTDPVITHVYDSIGTYTVNLTVTDNEGYAGTQIQSIPVSIHELNITSLSLSKATATAGEIVSVYVNVKNEGGFDETFNVTAYYDTTLIDTEVDETRDAGEGGVTTITWNTTGIAKGTYTIKAEVSTVPHEINTTNNIKTTTITILTHDIAVTSINVSPTTAKIGESITIDVGLTNEGSFTETFNVTTYHNGNIIETRTDISLDPGASTTETFTWNTAEASVGSYTIKAEAIIDTDLDIVDNTKTYETVTLEKATSTITIEISPTTVTVDGTVTINGTITPHREGVTVTINYKLSTEETWNTLSPVTTDENGQYTYEWTPTEPGTYKVKASWEGDLNTERAESIEETVTVETAQGFSLYYVIAGVGIIAVAAIILLYLLKIRKS